MRCPHHTLIALTFLAILGSHHRSDASLKVFAAADQPSGECALSATPGELVLTSPSPRHAIICETVIPLGSDTPAQSGTAPDVDVATGLSSPECSSVSHHGLLIKASILRKYLDFQESLTSP
jgi:hypothetical protein